MFDLALNRKDGDLVFNTNAQGFTELWFIDGRDRQAQKIKITLRMWLGEWFLDNTRGIPYLEVIFEKGTRLSTIENIVKSAILSVEDVEAITSFSMNVNNATRVLRIDYVCTTRLGLVKDSMTLDIMR